MATPDIDFQTPEQLVDWLARISGMVTVGWADLAGAFRRAIATEREACAQLVDDLRYPGEISVNTFRVADQALRQAADAIRARG